MPNQLGSCAFLSGKVYSVGGRSSGNQTHIFDVANGTWTRGPDFPHKLEQRTPAVVIGARMVIPSSEFRDVHEYTEGTEGGKWLKWDGELAEGDLLSKAGIVLASEDTLGCSAV